MSDTIVYGGRRIAIVETPALRVIKIIPLCGRGHSGSLPYDMLGREENVRLVRKRTRYVDGQAIRAYNLVAGSTRLGRLIVSITKDGMVVCTLWDHSNIVGVHIDT